jgi:hypothetical protein
MPAAALADANALRSRPSMFCVNTLRPSLSWHTRAKKWAMVGCQTAPLLDPLLFVCFFAFFPPLSLPPLSLPPLSLPSSLSSSSLSPCLLRFFFRHFFAPVCPPLLPITITATTAPRAQHAEDERPAQLQVGQRVLAKETPADHRGGVGSHRRPLFLRSGEQLWPAACRTCRPGFGNRECPRSRRRPRRSGKPRTCTPGK